MTSQNTPSKKDPEKKKRFRRPTGKRIMAAGMTIAALGLVFWLLWNWAVVPLFTFPSLTYLQALGAILLTGFLFRIGMCAAGRGRMPRHSHLALSGCRSWRCRPEGTRNA
jgi:amino acid transporter